MEMSESDWKEGLAEIEAFYGDDNTAGGTTTEGDDEFAGLMADIEVFAAAEASEPTTAEQSTKIAPVTSEMPQQRFARQSSTIPSNRPQALPLNIDGSRRLLGTGGIVSQGLPQQTSQYSIGTASTSPQTVS